MSGPVWKKSPDREEKSMRPSSDPENGVGIRSMFIIHQGALGDFILALPALEILRKAFPKAKLVIIGYPRILELVEKRFYADETLSIDQRRFASFFLQKGSLDPALSQFFSTFDLAVLFGRDGEGTLIENVRRVCQGRILHIDPFPRWDEKIHMADHLLKQFARYGLSNSAKNPKLYLRESDRHWAWDFWRSKGVDPEERSKVILIHPGSGSKRKVWPTERFLDLAHALQGHLGSKILVVLGPAEGPEVQKVFGRMESFVLAKDLSLLQLASVMEGCRLFIGNDSGISHMAAALGLPLIAIFGPTDPSVWSPRGERVFVVRKAIPCSPCSKERLLQCKDFECLRGIGVEEVFRGLEKLGIEAKS
jgi:ADP-heptose:LPS heptosyltransferase